MHIWRHYQRVVEEFVERHKGVLWLVGSFFVIGVVFGALAVRSVGPQDRSEIVSYLGDALKGLSPAPPGESGLLLRAALLRSLKQLAFLWVLGISLVGLPLTLVLAVVRGFVTGFTVAYMASELGWKGVGVAAAGHLPQGLLEVPALICAGAASVAFSLQVIRSWVERRRVANFYPALLRFTGTLVATWLVLLAAALVESYLTPVLVRFAASFLLQM
jgi:stage II sporulation protein M